MDVGFLDYPPDLRGSCLLGLALLAGGVGLLAWGFRGSGYFDPAPRLTRLRYSLGWLLLLLCLLCFGWFMRRYAHYFGPRG